MSNAQALHTKKDHYGNEILDDTGKPIPVDFVSTGNNHHVAIYRDEKGNLQDEVISFFEAVTRNNLGLSIINKNHEKSWEFLFSMKQNEFFIFPSDGFNPKEIDFNNLESQIHIAKRNLKVNIKNTTDILKVYGVKIKEIEELVQKKIDVK